MYMESMTIHAAGLPRRYPAPIQVASIGWIPRKQGLIDRPFFTYNFSIILTGSGVFRAGSQDYEISAPAVITQRPDTPMHYGPHDQWSELFFIFSPDFINPLKQENLWQDESWWWPLSSLTSLQNEVNSLLALMETVINQQQSTQFIADKIDRIALRIILETRLNQGSSDKTKDHRRAINEVQALFEANYQSDHHVDELARQHNLSPTHFRRLWQQQIGCSPQQYLHQVRMRSAARMLAAGQMPIQEIAAAVGHQDPLYFSKRFRTFFKSSPSEYRNAYKEVR